MNQEELNAERTRLETEHAEKLLAVVKKRNSYQLKMASLGTGAKIFLWLRTQWLDVLILFASLIVTMGLLGIVARIIWELWVLTFAVQI